QQGVGDLTALPPRADALLQLDAIRVRDGAQPCDPQLAHGADGTGRASTLRRVRTKERFWPARLGWRLRGATMWPAFVVLTLADGVLLHLFPPVRLGVEEGGMTIPCGIIVASVGNLFLIGAVAPFLARRLAARDALAGGAPVELRVDALRDR